MRKLLYTLALLGSLAAYGQSEFVATIGHLQGKEFIGDDIKNGHVASLGANLDLFGKKGFDFGPSLRVDHMSDLRSDIELIQSETVGFAGLNLGFNSDKVAFKATYQVPVLDEDLLFKSMTSGKLTFKNKKGNGFNVGVDYYFNRHIFHYTYSLNAGISIKL